MTALERQIRKVLAGLPLKVLLFDKDRGHYYITVQYEGREKRISVSSTPKNLDHCVRNFQRDLQRFMKGND